MSRRLTLAAKFSSMFTLGYASGSLLSARLWSGIVPGIWKWAWMPISVLAFAGVWWLSYVMAGDILKRTDAG